MFKSKFIDKTETFDGVFCSVSKCLSKAACSASEKGHVVFYCAFHTPHSYYKQEDSTKQSIEDGYANLLDQLKKMPTSRELSLSITNLEQSQFWLIKSKAAPARVNEITVEPF